MNTYVSFHETRIYWTIVIQKIPNVEQFQWQRILSSAKANRNPFIPTFDTNNSHITQRMVNISICICIWFTRWIQVKEPLVALRGFQVWERVCNDELTDKPAPWRRGCESCWTQIWEGNDGVQLPGEKAGSGSLAGNCRTGLGLDRPKVNRWTDRQSGRLH